MALFGLGDKARKSQDAGEPVYLLPGKRAYCRICEADRTFTRAWRRVKHVRQCPCCNLPFEDVAKVYAQHQPQCPRCEEPLEQPGFEYALCDGCGSKFELAEGIKPGWLPNLQQRQESAKHGKLGKPKR